MFYHICLSESTELIKNFTRGPFSWLRNLGNKAFSIELVLCVVFLQFSVNRVDHKELYIINDYAELSIIHNKKIYVHACKSFLYTFIFKFAILFITSKKVIHYIVKTLDKVSCRHHEVAHPSWVTRKIHSWCDTYL